MSGQVTGYLRCRLSSAVIHANVRCLLERMLLVGEGVGQAGRRRQWARQEEEKARWEREGQGCWRGAVAGKVDWEEPCEKGRLPLCLDVNDFQEVMIAVF